MESANSIIKASPCEAQLWSAVKSFEEDMFARVTKVQAMTEDMMHLMLFTPGSLRTVIAKWIVRSMSDDLSWAQLAGLKSLLYSYYFLFNLSHRAERAE